jgi:Predicted periplasmic ligand-binding sensor domain
MKLSLLQKVIAGFGLASALLIMVTYSGYQSARRLAQTKEWELHTIQVMSLLEDIMADIADAETGQRGYLLTVRSGICSLIKRRLPRFGMNWLS